MENLENLSKYPEIKRLEELEKESERIRKILEKYIPTVETKRLAKQFFDWAVELDEKVNEIKNTATIKEKYDYDGSFFVPKDKNRTGFSKCYDGLNFLKTFEDLNLKSFFTNKEQFKESISDLVEWVEKNFVGLTIWRMDNLKEYGDINLVPKEVLKEKLEELGGGKYSQKIKSKKEGLVPRKIPDHFFEEYERQMKKEDKK